MYLSRTHRLLSDPEHTRLRLPKSRLAVALLQHRVRTSVIFRKDHVGKIMPAGPFAIQRSIGYE